MRSGALPQLQLAHLVLALLVGGVLASPRAGAGSAVDGGGGTVGLDPGGLSPGSPAPGHTYALVDAVRGGSQPGEQLVSPSGITAMPDGGFMVADTNASRILCFNASGALQYLFTTAEPGGKLLQPIGLALDDTGAGRLYVISSNSPTVQVRDLQGKWITQWVGSAAAGAARLFSQPAGICAYISGYAFVIDRQWNLALKMDPTGEAALQLGPVGLEPGDSLEYVRQGRSCAIGRFAAPAGCAMLGDTVFVADTLNNRVQSFNALFGGSFSATFGEYGAAAGRFDRPTALAAGPESLFVVDSGNQRVQEVDEVGNLLSVFGGPGLLQAPAGVAVLADGGQAARVLVADAARGEVLIFQRTTGMPSPPPRPPPSPPSFPKCRPLERGTEYEGGDLTNGIIDGVASPGDCCALCFARPQCGAFSHDRSSRQCMLKATVGWRRMDATFVTSAQLRWPRVATCAPPQRGVYLHGCVIQAPDLSTDVGGVARAAVVGAQSTSTPTSRVLGITGIDATWQECCTLCTATAECAGFTRYFDARQGRHACQLVAAHVFEAVRVASLPGGQLQRLYGVPSWWGSFESYAVPLGGAQQPPQPPPSVAHQSSTLNASTPAGAGADGDYTTFSSTAAQVKPWWALDLKSAQKVVSVTLTIPFTADAPALMRDLEVRVGQQLPGGAAAVDRINSAPPGGVCSSSQGQLTRQAGAVFQLRCFPGPKQGRFVTLHIKSPAGRKDVLRIAELAVQFA